MRTNHYLAALAAFLVALAGCAQQPVSAPFTVSEVVLDQVVVQLAAGSSFQLAAHVNATGEGDTSVTWSSSDPALVRVDEGGLLSGVAPGGPVTVTATSKAKPSLSASALVTVLPAAEAFVVKSVTVTPGTAELLAGATLQLEASLEASGSGDRSLQWASSDTSVLTVDGTGLVSGVQPGGPVTVTASSTADPSKTSTALITVQAVPTSPSFSLSLEDDRVSVFKPSGAATASTSTIANLSRDEGFSGPVGVEVDAASLPAGVTASAAATSTADAWDLNLVVDSTVPAGAYSITVKASDGSTSRTAVLTLSVATYSFTVSPGSFTLARGASKDLSVSLTSVAVSGQLSLNLVATGNPRDKAAFKALLSSGKLTFGPATLNVAADGTASHTVSLMVAADAPVGQYRFKLELGLGAIRVTQAGQERLTIK